LKNSAQFYLREFYLHYNAGEPPFIRGRGRERVRGSREDVLEAGTEVAGAGADVARRGAGAEVAGQCKRYKNLYTSLILLQGQK